MKYRGIEIKTFGEHHIELFNPLGVEKDGNVVYKNGTIFVSIPENLRVSKFVFACKYIDTLYDRMQSHHDFETRHFLKKSLDNKARNV